MDCEADSNKESKTTLPGKVYLTGSLFTFAQGLYNPFLQDYVIKLGANLAEQGIFRSVGNFAPTVLQPIWGALSDRTGSRKKYVAFGIFTALFTVLLFFWARTPLEMIVLYGIQSTLLSIQIPTWTALISGFMDESNRGDELGWLAYVTNLTSLLATAISGIIAAFPVLIQLLRGALGSLGPILIPIKDPQLEIYYIPFMLTAIVGIIASIVAIRIEEKNDLDEGNNKFPPVLRLLSRPGDFRRFCFVATFFSFAMSMAWAYFMVVQSVWLKHSTLEIAVASIVMTLTTVAFSNQMGKLSDRIGRKPLIIIGRVILFVVPILYAFSLVTFGSLNIYIANAIAGFALACSMNANVAYIYDVSPEEERGSHLAVYNTFTGVVFLLGSLAAGLIGQWLMDFFIILGESAVNAEYTAVFIMLMTSGVLRFFASVLYFFLREPREYKSTLKMELTALMKRQPDATPQ
ncbi:MAG: MFS transporter [Candidatus Thorarchaeota archaeon]